MRKKRRLIPRVYYTNFRRRYGASLDKDCFRRWLSIRRYWGGALIYIGVLHHQLAFDFRSDVLADLLDTLPPRERPAPDTREAP